MSHQSQEALLQQQETLIQFTYTATAAAWPFFAVATVVFGLRSVSRLWYTEAPLGWEDIILSISWLLDVVRMVSFQLACNATRQVNPNDLPGTVPNATFWGLFTDSWAFLSVTLPKVGVAFLLIRIFRPRPWLRATIMSMAIGLFIVCVVGFIICFVQCSPVAGQWDPYTYPDTKCWPRNVQIDYALVGSSTSAFLDFCFAVYPGFVIWRLHMPTWKKLSIIGLMSLGLASFALAVIKVYNNTTLLGTPTLNELYTDALHIGLWNSLENDMILIAACIPSVPPVFAAFKSFSQTYASTSKRSGVKTGFSSLTSAGRHGPLEEHALEIARNGQRPGSSKRPNDKFIHVKHDFLLQRERAGHEDTRLPSSGFDV